MNFDNVLIFPLRCFFRIFMSLYNGPIAKHISIVNMDYILQHAYRDGRLEEVVLRHIGAEDGNTVIAKNIRFPFFSFCLLIFLGIGVLYSLNKFLHFTYSFTFYVPLLILSGSPTFLVICG